MELLTALKSLLATLTTKTTAVSTDGVMLANITDGTPNGKMTLPNLQKELATFPERSDVTDLNLETGAAGRHYEIMFVATSSAPANIPSNLVTQTRFYLIVLGNSGYYVEQILFGSDGTMFIRHKAISEWTTWKKVSTE